MKALQKIFASLITTISAAAILSSFATYCNAQTISSAGSTKLTGISAEILSQSNLSIRLDNVEVIPDIVTRTTRLRYAITNLGTEPVNRFSLLALVFDPAHNVKMGSKFTETLTVNPGEIKHNEVTLHNYLYLNPSKGFGVYELSVAGYESADGRWQQVPVHHLMLSLRSRAPLDGLYFQAISCGSECTANAASTCGEKNVASVSYSGTPPNCTCSFSCKGPVPLQE